MVNPYTLIWDDDSFRVKDGREILFLMNHNGERERVTLNDSYRDLLSGKEYRTGHSIEIEGKGVFVLLKEAAENLYSGE